MVLNTTRGPVEVPKESHENTGHTLNTSRVVEEDLAYEDEEPEILAVLSGAGWRAQVKDEEGLHAVPLVAWVAMDTGKLYGVVVGEDGRIDLTSNVEEYPAFTGYAHQANINR